MCTNQSRLRISEMKEILELIQQANNTLSNISDGHASSTWLHVYVNVDMCVYVYVGRRADCFFVFLYSYSLYDFIPTIYAEIHTFLLKNLNITVKKILC